MLLFEFDETFAKYFDENTERCLHFIKNQLTVQLYAIIPHFVHLFESIGDLLHLAMVLAQILHDSMIFFLVMSILSRTS